MNDMRTKSVLIEEISTLRKRNQELERSETARKQAEEELVAIRDRLSRAEIICRSGNWELDLASKRVFVSEGSRNLLGLLHGEWTIEEAQKLPLPEYRDMLYGAFRGLINGNQPCKVEFKIKRPDTGEIIDIYSVAKHDSGRNVVFGVMQDITERKRYEDALRESEDRFRSIASYTYDCESWIDENGKPVWINQAIFRLSGYTVDECMAMHDFPLSLIDDNDRNRLARLITSATRGSSGNDVEFRVRRKDGSLRWAAISWQPIYDGNGSNRGHRSTVRDITRRKQMEDELRRSHEKLELRVRERTAELQNAYNTVEKNERLYRNLFENASIGMFQSRLDGSGFLRINKSYATMLGYESPEEVMSAITDTETQIHTDPQNRHDAIAALERGDWYYAEQPYFRKDGSIMIGKLAVRNVLNPDGTPAYREGIVEDITESKEAERVLREREKQYRDLIENAPFPIVISDPEDSSIEYINQRASELFRISSQDAVGRPVAYYYDNPLGRELLVQQLQKTDSVKDYQVGLKNEKGERIWVLISANRARYNNKNAIFVSLNDITKRKLALDSLHESEIKYRTLFDHANFAILIVKDKVCVDCNKAASAVFGCSREEIIGQALSRFYPSPQPDGRGSAGWEQEGVDPALTGEPQFYEAKLCRYDGTLFDAEIGRKGIELDREHLVQVIVQDITHRKETERELERKSLSLEEMNIALKVLLEQRGRDRDELEGRILHNVSQLVLPYIDILKQRRLGEEHAVYLDVLEANLKNIVSPFIQKMTSVYENFTYTEIKVANLIKDGKTIKEIAKIFGVSEAAVHSHRQHIRNKLGIANQKTNLKTHLISLATR